MAVLGRDDSGCFARSAARVSDCIVLDSPSAKSGCEDGGGGGVRFV